MGSSRKRIGRVQKAMKGAESYGAWYTLAQELDRLEGHEAWRSDPSSPLYDHTLIQEHLDLFRQHRQSRQLGPLKELIEASLHRNLGDLSNPALYQVCHAGTKTLVEDYLDEVEKTFNWLCDTPLSNYPDGLKLGLVRQASRVFGRSALILSGGGALGLFHLGVVKSLWEMDLLPEVVSGASMGAVVAGGVCARTDAEVDDLWKNVGTIHRDAVKLQGLRAALGSGSLLSPTQLEEHVRANLGELTFREAFETSGRVLNIAVSPTRHRQKPRLLSHVTAPDILINTAAVASCSLPALFPPAKLERRSADGEVVPYVKGELWMDGSIHGDVPRMRLGRLHNVNHTIVSQANPHVLPFAAIKRKKGLVPMALDVATGTARVQTHQLLHLAERRMGSSLWRPSLEQARSLLGQNYDGDITILPQYKVTDMHRVMKNPSLKELEAYIRHGERASWPHLAMIRNQTRISRVMRACIKRLEARAGAEST